MTIMFERFTEHGTEKEKVFLTSTQIGTLYFDEDRKSYVYESLQGRVFKLGEYLRPMAKKKIVLFIHS
ncbi:MAG: hypothetical protein ACAH10_09910 [Methylophilaceae bacterium]|jgi:hypothetical protein